MEIYRVKYENYKGDQVKFYCDYKKAEEYSDFLIKSELEYIEKEDDCRFFTKKEFEEHIKEMWRDCDELKILSIKYPVIKYKSTLSQCNTLSTKICYFYIDEDNDEYENCFRIDINKIEVIE